MLYDIKKKSLILPTLISIVFFIIRIVEINATIPWVDEVMLADPAVNYLLHGTWVSTANHISFSLGQLLLVPWLFVFGISHISVCAYSAFWALLTSLLIIYFLHRKHFFTSTLDMCLFVFLFWSAQEMAFMTTNGRYDTLVMFLTTALVFLLLDKNKIELKNFCGVTITSFLLFWSGVTSLPFILVAIFIIFLSGIYDRNIIFFKGLGVLVGILFSWLFNAGIYYINGCYGYYKHLYFSYSATFNNKEQITFFMRLWNSYFVNVEAFVLLIINILLFGVLTYNNHSCNKKRITYFIAYMCIPFAMCVAGRYPIYYTWSFWVSGAIWCVYLIKELKINKIILISFCVISSVFCMYKFAIKDFTTYKKINDFVEQLKFNKDDVIISHYAPYFVIVKKYQKSLFCAEYWMELPKNINYILVYPKQFGASSLFDIMQELKTNGKNISKYSESPDGNLQVYKVMTKDM